MGSGASRPLPYEDVSPVAIRRKLACLPQRQSECCGDETSLWSYWEPSLDSPVFQAVAWSHALIFVTEILDSGHGPRLKSNYISEAGNCNNFSLFVCVCVCVCVYIYIIMVYLVRDFSAVCGDNTLSILWFLINVVVVIHGTLVKGGCF